MSKIIWKDLDDGKQVVGNQITRSEFDIIKSYSNKLILGKLGQNTILTNATKNKLGYCLYRCCAKSREENCESKFRVYMNIHTHTTTLRFNQLCRHKLY